MKTQMQLATQMFGCWGEGQGGDVSGALHGRVQVLGIWVLGKQQ